MPTTATATVIASSKVVGGRDERERRRLPVASPEPHAGSTLQSLDQREHQHLAVAAHLSEQVVARQRRHIVRISPTAMRLEVVPTDIRSSAAASEPIPASGPMAREIQSGRHQSRNEDRSATPGHVFLQSRPRKALRGCRRAP
jgi:hypothetical protein